MAEVDSSILKKYTVDELDMLHNLVGLGPEWQKSYRRKELLEIETRELELMKEIIEDMHIVSKEEQHEDPASGSDPGEERGR